MRKIDYYIRQFNKENNSAKVIGLWYQKRRANKRKKQLSKIAHTKNYAFKMLNSSKLTIDKKIEELKRIAFKGYGIKLKQGKYKYLRRKKNALSGEICYICGEKAYCMHHIVPLYLGGDNKENNLIPICRDCHKKIHPFMIKDEKIKTDSIYDYLQNS